MCILDASIPDIVLSEITYESMKDDPYTDHVRVFKQLFDRVEISSMVEFGLGVGTKFFLDNVDRVISIEMLCADQTDEWYNYCIELYKGYSNWSQNLFQGSSLITWANRAVIRGEDPALVNPAYLLELEQAVSIALVQPVELVFVDCDVHNRGDIVNLLFNKVDIIVAHDTKTLGKNVYGWEKILPPANYHRFMFTKGQGIVFWVKDNRSDVMEVLQTMVDSNQY